MTPPFLVIIIWNFTDPIALFLVLQPTRGENGHITTKMLTLFQSQDMELKNHFATRQLTPPPKSCPVVDWDPKSVRDVCQDMQNHVEILVD